MMENGEGRREKGESFLAPTMTQNRIPYDFINKLKAFPWVEEIWLFGSRARGDHQERSDIDLAILCPTANEKDWGSILQIIDKADTLLKIDCIRFDTLSPDDKFRDNILRFKQILYKKGDGVDEIFWKDYFYRLGDALDRFQEVMGRPDLAYDECIHNAAIQRFEFVTELFWKALKKILTYEKADTTTPHREMFYLRPTKIT
jgi:uncharacterized protein